MYVIHTPDQKLRRNVRLKFLEIRDFLLRSVFCAANQTKQIWKIVFVVPFSWSHALPWLQRHLHPAVSQSANTSLQSCEVVSGSAKNVYRRRQKMVAGPILSVTCNAMLGPTMRECFLIIKKLQLQHPPCQPFLYAYAIKKRRCTNRYNSL
jgi:hypothetical protein